MNIQLIYDTWLAKYSKCRKLNSMGKLYSRNAAWIMDKKLSAATSRSAIFKSPLGCFHPGAIISGCAVLGELNILAMHYVVKTQWGLWY